MTGRTGGHYSPCHGRHGATVLLAATRLTDNDGVGTSCFSPDSKALVLLQMNGNAKSCTSGTFSPLSFPLLA